MSRRQRRFAWEFAVEQVADLEGHPKKGKAGSEDLRGLPDWKHLSFASSLCGACTETCPVKIDLHHHLLHNRRNAAALESGQSDRISFRAFAFLVNHPGVFEVATKVGRLLQYLHRFVAGSKIDPLLAFA
jgi:L-lactate dehydrogenase complex protein LldF